MIRLGGSRGATSGRALTLDPEFLDESIDPASGDRRLTRLHADRYEIATIGTAMFTIERVISVSSHVLRAPLDTPSGVDVASRFSRYSD